MARVIDSLVDTIDKLRFGQDGNSLVGEFAQLADQYHSYSATASDWFYNTLLLASFGRGLAILGRQAASETMLKLAIEFVGELGYLDHIDAASNVITAIEQLPLTNRRSLLVALANSIVEVANSGWCTSGTIAFLWKLLDQLIESAFSKDTLTMALFKQYLDHDELLIRERIQRDM